MPLSLPPIELRPLKRAPLVAVVLQLRFEQNLVLSDTVTGLSIHEDLGGQNGQYPIIEPQRVLSTQVEFSTLGGAGQLFSAPIQVNGWRLRSEDGAWVVTLMPTFVSLETTSYTKWRGDFRDRAEALLRSVARHVNPRVEERLGLRYVNKISEPSISVVRDFADIISDDLYSPVSSEFWSVGITGFQAQIEVDLEGGARGIVRHGVIPDARGSFEGYLIDFDIYSQQPRRFDVDVTLKDIDAFNNSASSLFEKSLMPDYLSRLQEGDEA